MRSLSSGRSGPRDVVALEGRSGAGRARSSSARRARGLSNSSSARLLNIRTSESPCRSAEMSPGSASGISTLLSARTAPATTRGRSSSRRTRRSRGNAAFALSFDESASVAHRRTLLVARKQGLGQSRYGGGPNLPENNRRAQAHGVVLHGKGGDQDPESQGFRFFQEGSPPCHG